MDNHKQILSENPICAKQNQIDFEGTQRISGADPPIWQASDFITEAEAYASLGDVLEDKELRQARNSGRLGFMRRKRTIFYRRDELEAFVSSILRQDYVGPCTTSNKPERTEPSRVRLPSRPDGHSTSSISPEVRQRALKMISSSR